MGKPCLSRLSTYALAQATARSRTRFISPTRSVTERVGLMKRVRDLAVACAKAYVESRERQGYPMLRGADREAYGIAAEVSDAAR